MENTRSFDEWLQYLSSLHANVIALGLERVQQVAAMGQYTDFSVPVVVIGGTNGKGSCVAYLEDLLRAAGYAVGAYTSPHFFHYSERIRVNQRPVSETILCEAFACVEKNRGDVPLTFFEYSTLAALHIFQETPLDVLLLEVGLGGAQDAVNVVDSDIAVITSVDLDHQDYLGTDRAAIAGEKAGIFRPNKPAICGDINPPAVIQERSSAVGAKLYQLGRDFCYSVVAEQGCWNWWSKQQEYRGLPLPALSVSSAATALMVCELLIDTQQDARGKCLRFPVNADANADLLHLPHEALRSNTQAYPPRLLIDAFELFPERIAATRLQGRFEYWPPNLALKRCRICFDVAHNPAAATHLANHLSQQPPMSLHAVVGMLSDKDTLETLRPLLPFVSSWHLGGLSGERGLSGMDFWSSVVSLLSEQRAKVYDSVVDAYDGALTFATEADTLLVFGSFYTVAAVQRHVMRQNEVS